MKKSNRENRSRGTEGGKKFRRTDSGKSRFGSRGDHNRFGDRDSSRNVSMHKAICSECGAECELPFKPTGDKPVFCSNCFGSRAHSNRPGGRDSVNSHFQEKRMHSAICTECGAQCDVPFRPTGGKPIYCKNCFRKGDSTPGKTPEQFRDQFAIVNAKLDNILKLLTPIIFSDAAREQKLSSKIEVPKLQKDTKKQTKGTISPKKTVKKKVVAKKTVAKKATSKPRVPKSEKAVKRQTKGTISPKKTVKKKAVAKKTVAKKATRKKKN